jgi:hypothetical protein
MCPGHPVLLDFWSPSYLVVVQIMKLLILKPSPVSCHCLHVRSKYLPQHPILGHPQTVFCHWFISIQNNMHNYTCKYWSLWFYIANTWPTFLDEMEACTPEFNQFILSPCKQFSLVTVTIKQLNFCHIYMRFIRPPCVILSCILLMRHKHTELLQCSQLPHQQLINLLCSSL